MLIPTSMWARSLQIFIYLFYLFTQSFNAMIKTAQRSVTHASQTTGTIILSTTTTTTTTTTNNNNNNNNRRKRRIQISPVLPLEILSWVGCPQDGQPVPR